MIRRSLQVLALVLALALVAAACGNDDDDTTTADTATEEATADDGGAADDEAADTATAEATADDDEAADDGEAMDDEAADDGGDESAAASEADPTAILNYGQMRADSLDPINQGVPCEETMLFTIFDTLVTLDDGGNPEPMLAESWEVMDGNVLRLNLKEGVTFQDGTPMDAEAVAFSLDRVLNDPDSNISTMIANVEDVSVVDDLTVDLQMSSDAVAPTLAGLGDRAGMVVSPTAVEAAGSSDAFSRAPVGAGPYAIEGEWFPRESLSVRAWDGYWDPSAQNVGGIDFTEFTQDQLNALRAGDMDVVALEPIDGTVAQGDDSLKVTVGPSDTFRIFLMNETLEPFDDELVRQAVAYAIDREAIAEIQTQGLAPAAYQMWPEGSLPYDPSLNDLYPYDPDRARELLAEAGYEDGLDIESAIGSSATSYVQQGELIQAQLAEVGINMDLQLIDAAAAIPLLFSEGESGEGDMASSPFGGTVTEDPDQAFRNVFSAEGSFNAGGNEPPGVMELVDQAAASTDPDERADLYQQANAIITEGVWHGVPIYFVPGITATQDYVGGVTEGVTACYASQDFFRTIYITEGREPTDG